MREPHLAMRGDSYSSLTAIELKNISLTGGILGDGTPLTTKREHEWHDVDFRKRYAAFLLKERGL